MATSRSIRKWKDPLGSPPLSAFRILLTPEITLVFIFVSFLYMEYYCVLPGGVGCIISSLLNGKLLDYAYQKEEKRVGGGYREKPEDFRIFRTRLFCLIPFSVCFLTASLALGWALHYEAPLPVTLIINFFVGLGTGTTASATVYGQDLKPGQGGAVSASLNLTRCLLAAVGTAFIHILYEAIGAGWTFLAITGAVLMTVPLPFIAIKNGEKWRKRRQEKKAVLPIASVELTPPDGFSAAKEQ
ncbi:hypothetical protein RQP46_010017 [Phenoliferia psychrophenolica]